MAHIAGMVALGMLKPAQANAIRASYREILQHHQRTQSLNQSGAIADMDVLALMQKDPSILNMLAPLLTAEQLAMVMELHGGDDSATS